MHSTNLPTAQLAVVVAAGLDQREILLGGGRRYMYRLRRPNLIVLLDQLQDLAGICSQQAPVSAPNEALSHDRFLRSRLGVRSVAAALA